MADPTPTQIHQYDQAHALRTDELDALITATRATMTSGRRRDMVIGGVASYLHEQFPHDACAEILACALERFATQGEDQAGA
jgi:hypothetical protein